MGAPEYVIGSPAFRHARVELQGGAVLTVNAANNSRENVYVQSLKINGTPWTKTWVPHELIAKGATLDFEMGPQPSRWGSGADDVPRSLTRAQRPQLLHDLLGSGAEAALADGRALPALVDDDAATSVGLGGGATITLTGLGDGTPTMYTLTSGDGRIQGGEWTLEARNGNGRWTVLDQRSGEAFESARQTRPFRIARPGRYDAYRLRLAAPAGCRWRRSNCWRPAPYNEPHALPSVAPGPCCPFLPQLRPDPGLRRAADPRRRHAELPGRPGALAAPQRKRIIDTFYFAYLRERADFHPAAPAMVRIVIDPAYTGIAFVGDKDQAATITINPGWLAQHPNDIDLVTHEAMHIVQGYPAMAMRGCRAGWWKASPTTRATATAWTMPLPDGHCRARSRKGRTSTAATGSPARS